jgi:nucleoside-diphosphate-sugar epimerase
MKILITGGSGSLGSYTVPRLIEKGHEIKVFDKRTHIFKGTEYILIENKILNTKYQTLGEFDFLRIHQ